MLSNEVPYVCYQTRFRMCVIVCIAFFCNLDIRSMVVPQTSEPKLT